MTATNRGRRAGFVVTKEHRRFAEFADAVRRERYIGLCYGSAGVGKTVSGRHYGHWHRAQPLIDHWGPRENNDPAVYAALDEARTVFYTPTVSPPIRQIRSDLTTLTDRVEICIQEHIDRNQRIASHPAERVELVIVDEAERLSTPALELLRDRFDRGHHGLILIGMPGIEKRLSRYPQLYSRVGFAHHYRPLGSDELAFVLEHHWDKLGLALDATDFTDAQAIAAVARITGGNFRLIQRLFVQIERILAINNLRVVTSEVVETARSTLVIGTI